MILSVHQPSYFPWLGLLHKICQSDVYCVLDNVQLADRAFQHRNYFIKNYELSHLLTIPIIKRGYRACSIREIRVASPDWQEKHLKYLKFNYAKHPYFDDIFPVLEQFYAHPYSFLYDAVVASMQILFELLSIRITMTEASVVQENKPSDKLENIIDLVQRHGASTYLSGEGARTYQDEAAFRQAGIRLEYQRFIHPVYPQYRNPHFISGLSALDMLFNLGREASTQLLWQLCEQRHEQ